MLVCFHAPILTGRPYKIKRNLLTVSANCAVQCRICCKYIRIFDIFHRKCTQKQGE